MRKYLFTIVCLISFSSFANVVNQNDGLEITSVWARPSSASMNTAVYMKIKNNSSNTELKKVSADNVNADPEIHTSFVDQNGVSRMKPVDKILIPSNTEIELKPAGMHVMLMDLKNSLNVGDKFFITLYFVDSGTAKNWSKTVEVRVGL